MFEGVDRMGQNCRLFIENSGMSLDNCIPRIYTGSSELAFLEKAQLKVEVAGIENGVIVKIYMCNS